MHVVYTRRCSCVKKGNKCCPSCRCKNCSNTPSATGTQQQSSDEFVGIKEEGLFHDDSLRRKYGDVCGNNEKDGHSNSSVSDADIDEDNM